MDKNLKEYYNKIYYGEKEEIEKDFLFDSKEKVAKFWINWFERIFNLLKVQSAAGKKLLDVGCGDGTFAGYAESKGLRVHGIDFSETAIEKAKKKFPNVKFSVGDAENLEFESDFFDYITCNGSLEHVPNMSRALKEMHRSGNENCKYFILVPNEDYIMELFGYKPEEEHLVEIMQPLNQMKSKKGWIKFLNENGFNIERILVDNNHFLNPQSSSKKHHIIKKIIKPFVPLIPAKFSYQLGFFCTKIK
ncbi:MAG: class I SAM-dependent methyltransferase [Ignavibacteria bacterium]|nr:class I SAM-dependent methyltransferase [Ignavibacteria bacterium]